MSKVGCLGKDRGWGWGEKGEGEGEKERVKVKGGSQVERKKGKVRSFGEKLERRGCK
jgi:hypothetical protein